MVRSDGKRNAKLSTDVDDRGRSRSASKNSSKMSDGSRSRSRSASPKPYTKKPAKEQDAREILRARRESKEASKAYTKVVTKRDDKRENEMRSGEKRDDKRDSRDERSARGGLNNENHRRKDQFRGFTNPEPPRGYPNPLIHRGKNTETFEPSYKPADMRVRVVSHKKIPDAYPNDIAINDAILVPDLYHDYEPREIYDKLLDEIHEIMEMPRYKKSDIWKPWHGDNHLIADDKSGWTDDAPFFRKLMDRICDYFNMDIRATRFNWYKDDTDWKPYHFDAAAVKADKSKSQNMTIGVSFGAVRDIAFEHHETRTRVSFPLDDGSAFGFGRLINYNFRHGVPPIHPKNQTKKEDTGRISIIAWGVTKQIAPL